MRCWSSASAEGTMNIIVFTTEKKEKDKLWDKWSKEQSVAREKGIKKMYNDTLFIDITRSDSLYNSFLTERNNVAENILHYKDKVPFFSKFIDKIANNVIEYKYYGYYGEKWGIYEKTFKKDRLFTPNDFYESFVDLLKEGYSSSENSFVNENDVLSLHTLLRTIEELDKKLWAVKYFKESKKELEERDLEKKRQKQIDSLLSK
jgi:hypothetical protein